MKPKAEATTVPLAVIGIDSRLCNARSHKGLPCRQPALRGNVKCYWHGARGGRPPGKSDPPSAVAARVEGRRRWVERMREAKARGEVERFPGGRRKRGLPPGSPASAEAAERSAW
jgi:hypothetical protein